MAQPIYRLWTVRMTDTGISRSDDEWNSWAEDRDGCRREVGARSILSSRCLDAGWTVFGVTEYPDDRAIAQHEEALERMKRKHRIATEGWSLLGFKTRGDLEVTGLPIFRLFAAKRPQGYYKPTAEDAKALGEAMTRNGGRIVVMCDAIAQPWRRFGVEQWPSLEAINAYTGWIGEFQSQHNLYWDGLNVHGVALHPEP